MSGEISVNSSVIANDDGKNHKKGDVGIVVNMGYIDSEEYLIVRLDSGITIGPSLIDYWDLNH